MESRRRSRLHVFPSDVQALDTASEPRVSTKKIADPKTAVFPPFANAGRKSGPPKQKDGAPKPKIPAAARARTYNEVHIQGRRTLMTYDPGKARTYGYVIGLAAVAALILWNFLRR
jgi:hypothetical protein